MYDTWLRRMCLPRLPQQPRSRAFRVLLGVQIALGPSLLASSVALGKAPSFSPGGPGIGDAYFPLDGNGGYEVEHYSLDVRYDPESDYLAGVATLRASATQDLSSFHLDLVGLEVRAVAVNDDAAGWEREGGELIVTPKRGLHAGAPFSVVIDYDGVPQTLSGDAGLPVSGFIHTFDGAIAAGEPHVASTWFPANDHPRDPATFTFHVTVPEGLEAIANGVLVGQETRDGWTTWVWNAESPMATYLAGLVIGELQMTSYEADGIQYWDAIAPSLFEPSPIASPATGLKLLGSSPVDASYQRLSRVISVPPEGAELSFAVTVSTEASHDFFFVEAHGVGRDDWTTLSDVDGFATSDTGEVCPSWLALHPSLRRYQAPSGDAALCDPQGDTGAWWAASGSQAEARWTIDLSRWAGTDVEVVLSYASDEAEQASGVFIDDIVVSTGVGSTSFEDDGDTLDGWSISGGAEGGSPSGGSWAVGGAVSVPSIIGEVAPRSLERQPEIIAFLEQSFGAYPFDTAGAVVPNYLLMFALENQTRPIYSPYFFFDAITGDTVVAHELTHQWFGDSVRLDAWQHIWLNEGFAAYAEWLWQEHEGITTAQASFDAAYSRAEDDPFWSLSIGDPGPERLFDFAVYDRGAMTLQQLRRAVGDDAFFSILEEWASCRAGQTVTTDDFIAFAEALSGQELSDLFEAWLFTPSKPSVAGCD